MGEGIPKDGTAPLKHLIAGGLAGAISRTAVSPLERIKILFQVQGGHGPAKKYNGVVHSLVTILKEEGWRGYFKGNGTNVIRIFPYSAIQFAAYEQFKKILLREKNDLTPLERLSAGAMAGVVSVSMTYPLDLIRTRLSVQTAFRNSGSLNPAQYLGITSAFITIVKQEGIFGLFKGIMPTLMGIAPYVGLNFMTFEGMKSVVKKKIRPDPTTVHLLICGGMAGSVAQTITYPFDVLRRKMQMQGYHSHPAYPSTWNCIVSIWKSESIYGFYKGLIPNYLKVVPSMSISFVVYEKVKHHLRG